jgi:hypothetical protein
MAHKVSLFGRHWHLPQSKPIRIGFGILLIVGGLLGFLPVLGFWMIPLGLFVLSVDIPIVRRWRRHLAVQEPAFKVGLAMTLLIWKVGGLAIALAIFA